MYTVEINYIMQLLKSDNIFLSFKYYETLRSVQL